MTSSITVATWNLWWRFGDWASRAAAIQEVLAAEPLQAVGLQEVWATGERNLAGELADRLGLRWVWCPSPQPGRWQTRLGEHGVDYGNAVLSCWPVLDHAVLHLPPGDVVSEGRTALFCSIDVPGGPLPFFTTQLNSAPHQSGIRCQQVRALAAFVAERSAGLPLPQSWSATSTPHPPRTRSACSVAI